MVAPITIEIIIHYYVTSDEAEDFRDSPAFKENLAMLIDNQLLDIAIKGKRKYTANREACEAYINALCSVPFPKQKWVVIK